MISIISKSKFAYWALAFPLALAFGIAGSLKLSGNPMSLEIFDRFGYSALFMYFIGACELAGALGLVLGPIIDRRLPRLAALSLLLVMLGAIVSHLLNDASPLTTMIPAVALSMLLISFAFVARKTESALTTVYAQY